MPSPIITFRLTPYQLARGLQIVRSLEPGFQLTSIGQLVKIVYTDYLAKMTLGQSDVIEPEIMADIQNFIINPQKKEINLSSLVDDEEKLASSFESKLSMPLPDENDRSSISTVTDFSPPKDWMDENEETIDEDDYKDKHFNKGDY